MQYQNSSLGYVSNNMSKNITYNAFDLQDDNFRTRNIVYRNLPNKTIDVEPKVRSDGFRIVNTYYDSKDISVNGTLTRDTEANLKISLDLMKESLNIDEANLDIDDGGGTIRYVCSVTSLDVPEDFYHITQIPYRIVFRCEPFGKATSGVTDTSSFSSSPSSSTLNPTGSAPPLPALKWTCDGAPTSAITQISFSNITTGQSITVGSLTLDANGDYLEVDCEDLSVKVSYDGGAATEIDFTGVFPNFIAGSNSYTVTITGGGATWTLDQEITYTPLYL